MLSGPAVHIFRSAHNTCKPELTQTPLFPFPLSASTYLFISIFYPFPQTVASGKQGKKTNSGRAKTKERRRKSQGWEAAGAWCWGCYEVSVFCVHCVSRVYKSVHTYAMLCASHLSIPSIKPLLVRLVVVSVALPSCCALFSPMLLMHGLSPWTHLLSSWLFVAVQMSEVDATLEKSLNCPRQQCDIIGQEFKVWPFLQYRYLGFLVAEIYIKKKKVLSLTQSL